MSKLREEIITSEFANYALDNVTDIYGNDLYNLIVFEAIGSEMDVLLKYFREFDQQVMPQNAPNWILEYWADLYQVQTKGKQARWFDLMAQRVRWQDLSHLTWEELGYYQGSDAEARREVLARMRTRAPINKFNFTDYLERLTGYHIELMHFPEDYTITIKMSGGADAHLLTEELYDIIREIIPAHVDFFVSVESMTWLQWDALNLKWKEVDEMNIKWKDMKDPEVWTKWINERQKT